MPSLIATIVTTVAAGLVGLAPATATAEAKAPTPAQVQAYECAVAGNVGECQHIPGAWNAWSGRVTPPRWDPCRPDTGAGLIYGRPCTRRSVSLRQWCTLHFDHRVAGWDLCRGPYSQID